MYTMNPYEGPEIWDIYTKLQETNRRQRGTLCELSREKSPVENTPSEYHFPFCQIFVHLISQVYILQIFLYRLNDVGNLIFFPKIRQKIVELLKMSFFLFF